MQYLIGIQPNEVPLKIYLFQHQAYTLQIPAKTAASFRTPLFTPLFTYINTQLLPANLSSNLSACNSTNFQEISKKIQISETVYPKTGQQQLPRTAEKALTAYSLWMAVLKLNKQNVVLEEKYLMTKQHSTFHLFCFFLLIYSESFNLIR